MVLMAYGAALLAGIALSAALQGQPTDGDRQMDTDAAEIRELTKEFVQGFNTGDLDRIMKFYADEYVDVNLRQPNQTKAERREYYRKLIDSGEFRVEVTPDEIVIAGEYGFVRGTILLERPQAGGNARTKELRYVEVWRRFADGWKSIWGIDADVHPEEE